MFTDVAPVENLRQPPRPCQIRDPSTPENLEFSAVERSPKFIHVTDVARSQKSPVFRHVGTPTDLTERGGGRMWSQEFSAPGVECVLQPFEIILSLQRGAWQGIFEMLLLLDLHNPVDHFCR
jgi:hypothetical protein